MPGIQAADEHFYQIPALATISNGEHRDGIRLVVKDTRSNVFLNSNKIVFSSDGVEQGYYQYASWVEPPPKRFANLLLHSLDEAQLFDSVTSISALSVGNYQLNTELIECFHNTSTRPGKGTVKVRVELIETLRRSLVAQNVFTSEVELKAYDARSAVDAISQAMHESITEIVKWLAQQKYLAGEMQRSKQPN